MKVQVPFDMVIREAFRKEPTPIDFYDAFKRGVYFGIDSANEQRVNASPTKRPFVSDGEIIQRTDQLHNNSRTERMCFAAGATWIRDKYEARDASDAPPVEPKWQPVVGDKCAFWSYDGVTLETGFGVLDEIYPADSEKYLCSCGQWYEHVAALESIDEIGKPPSYFIERGRCTV